MYQSSGLGLAGWAREELGGEARKGGQWRREAVLPALPRSPSPKCVLCSLMQPLRWGQGGGERGEGFRWERWESVLNKHFPRPRVGSPVDMIYWIPSPKILGSRTSVLWRWCRQEPESPEPQRHLVAAGLSLSVSPAQYLAPPPRQRPGLYLAFCWGRELRGEVAQLGAQTRTRFVDSENWLLSGQCSGRNDPYNRAGQNPAPCL